MAISYSNITASHLNIHKYSFSQCIVNDWNSLPQDIVEAPICLFLNPNWIFIGIIITLYLANIELSWFYKTMSFFLVTKIFNNNYQPSTKNNKNCG